VERVPCGRLMNTKLADKQRAFIEEHGRARSNIRGWQQMRHWVDNLSAIPSVEEIGAHTEAPYSTHDMAGMIETRPCRGVSPLIHVCQRLRTCMTTPKCWYT